jgi:hypothetical protein
MTPSSMSLISFLIAVREKKGNVKKKIESEGNVKKNF